MLYFSPAMKPGAFSLGIAKKRQTILPSKKRTSEPIIIGKSPESPTVVWSPPWCFLLGQSAGMPFCAVPPEWKKKPSERNWYALLQYIFDGRQDNIYIDSVNSCSRFWTWKNCTPKSYVCFHAGNGIWLLGESSPTKVIYICRLELQVLWMKDICNGHMEHHDEWWYKKIDQHKRRTAGQVWTLITDGLF